MRMIGIGLLAFLIVGAALAVTNFDALSRGVRAVENVIHGPQLVFEQELSSPPVSKDQMSVFYRNHTTNSLILSGFPAYQGATFLMPIDARPTSGYLQIDATFQVLTGVEGAMRISINNTRRAEVLLHPGEAARSLQIVLTQEDLAGERLVVSFSLLGQGLAPACGQDGAVNAIVEIEATSGVFLELESPARSVRDRIIGWGNAIYIKWPNAGTGAKRSEILAQAAMLQRVGYAIRFEGAEAQQALQAAELKNLLEAASANLNHRPTQHLNWPQEVSEKGANAGARRFQHSTSWRIRYDLSRYEGFQMPGALDLNVMLGPLPKDAHWTLSVTLNARLIDLQTLKGSMRDHVFRVTLPKEHQDVQNLIEVTATSSYDPEGLCSDGPDLIAEMRSESRLLPSGESLQNGIHVLQARLQEHEAYDLDVSRKLSEADAQSAAILLAAAIPGGLRPTTVETTVSVKVLSREATSRLTEPSLLDGSETWLVFRDSETLAPKAQLLTPATLNRTDAPVGLLVVFPELEE